MTNNRLRLKANLLIGLITAIAIFLFADGVGNIYAEVNNNSNVVQNNTQIIEKSNIKRNAEIEEKTKENKLQQEKIEKQKDNTQETEEQKKKGKLDEEEGKATEEKAEEKKKILKIEYKDGLLSVDLQNVDITEALKEISKVANIEIDIGPGIEGKIEKIQFQNFSWEKAMERLIAGKGSGIVVEYEKEKAKKISLSKKIVNGPDSDFDKNENIIDLTLKRRSLSRSLNRRVNNLDNIFSKIVLFDISGHKDMYIKKFGKKPKILGDVLLFFNDKGELIKELYFKNEKKIVMENKKKFIRRKVTHGVFSETGKNVLVIDMQWDQVASTGEDYNNYNVKTESFFYSYNGELLFQREDKELSPLYCTVSENGNYIVLSSNAILSFPPGRSFLCAYDKLGAELYRLNVGFLSSDAPFFSTDEEYVFAKVVGLANDKRKAKKYLIGIDIKNQKHWKHEYRETFSRIKEDKKEGLILINDGRTYIYEYTYDGILKRIRKIR